MMRRIRRVLADPDRGSEAVPLAIVAPAMILLLGLMVVGGRVAIAAQSISGVAGNAARDASIARSAPEAVQLATRAALASLREQNLHCQGSPDVQVDTTGFRAPPGTAASIRVDVTCVVSIRDVGIPGLPGSRTLRDHATSPLDPHRAVAP